MTDEEIVAEVRKHPDEVVTAGDIADQIDMTSAGVLQRLNQLHEDGVVTRKKVGARAVVWWLNESQASDARSRP
jgi:predicted ArsR family transcriptional regulator